MGRLEFRTVIKRIDFLVDDEGYTTICCPYCRIDFREKFENIEDETYKATCPKCGRELTWEKYLDKYLRKIEDELLEELIRKAMPDSGKKDFIK